jgi:hypothetical protein
MKRTRQYSIFIFSLLFIFSSCSSDKINETIEKSTAFIVPPFENVGVEALLFKISNGSDTLIKINTNSYLKFLAGSFVDEQGNAIEGDVDIEYVEYRTPGEILTSGIPMDYSSGDLTYNFQSAGMFDIRAFQRGESVYVAENKSVEVAMASNVPGDDYNFYHLDEENEMWSEKEKNIKTIELMNNQHIKVVKEPIIPKEYNPDAYTFDLEIPYKRFPGLESIAGVMWQYAGSSSKNDPKNNPQLINKKWKNIRLDPIKKKPGNYLLKLKNNKESYQAEVVPVLRGKALKSAEIKFNKELAAFAEYQQALADEKIRKDIENKILRIFALKKMGIYNYDRQLKEENAIPMFADFNFDGGLKDDVNKVNVFLITGNGQSVIKYPKHDWDLFAFVPEYDNKLIAVLPGDEICVFSDKDFKGIDLNTYTPKERKEYLFSMMKMKTKIQSPEQLDEIIAGL